jgi:hypothetical protein
VKGFGWKDGEMCYGGNMSQESFMICLYLSHLFEKNSGFAEHSVFEISEKTLSQEDMFLEMTRKSEDAVKGKLDHLTLSLGLEAFFKTNECNEIKQLNRVLTRLNSKTKNSIFLRCEEMDKHTKGDFFSKRDSKMLRSAFLDTQMQSFYMFSRSAAYLAGRRLNKDLNLKTNGNLAFAEMLSKSDIPIMRNKQSVSRWIGGHKKGFGKKSLLDWTIRGLDMTNMSKTQRKKWKQIKSHLNMRQKAYVESVERVLGGENDLKAANSSNIYKTETVFNTVNRLNLSCGSPNYFVMIKNFSIVDVIVSLFPKKQIGAAREIFIMCAKIRIMVKVLELFCSLIGKHDKIDMLAKGKEKQIIQSNSGSDIANMRSMHNSRSSHLLSAILTYRDNSNILMDELMDISEGKMDLDYLSNLTANDLVKLVEDFKPRIRTMTLMNLQHSATVLMRLMGSEPEIKQRDLNIYNQAYLMDKLLSKKTCQQKYFENILNKFDNFSFNSDATRWSQSFNNIMSIYFLHGLLDDLDDNTSFHYKTVIKLYCILLAAFTNKTVLFPKAAITKFLNIKRPPEDYFPDGSSNHKVRMAKEGRNIDCNYSFTIISGFMQGILHKLSNALHSALDRQGDRVTQIIVNFHNKLSMIKLDKRKMLLRLVELTDSKGYKKTFREGDILRHSDEYNEAVKICEVLVRKMEEKKVNFDFHTVYRPELFHSGDSFYKLITQYRGPKAILRFFKTIGELPISHHFTNLVSSDDKTKNCSLFSDVIGIKFFKLNFVRTIEVMNRQLGIKTNWPKSQITKVCSEFNSDYLRMKEIIVPMLKFIYSSCKFLNLSFPKKAVCEIYSSLAQICILGGKLPLLYNLACVMSQYLNMSYKRLYIEEQVCWESDEPIHKTGLMMDEYKKILNCFELEENETFSNCHCSQGIFEDGLIIDGRTNEVESDYLEAFQMRKDLLNRTVKKGEQFLPYQLGFFPLDRKNRRRLIVDLLLGLEHGSFRSELKDFKKLREFYEGLFTANIPSSDEEKRRKEFSKEVEPKFVIEEQLQDMGLSFTQDLSSEIVIRIPLKMSRLVNSVMDLYTELGMFNRKVYSFYKRRQILSYNSPPGSPEHYFRALLNRDSNEEVYSSENHVGLLHQFVAATSSKQSRFSVRPVSILSDEQMKEKGWPIEKIIKFICDRSSRSKNVSNLLKTFLARQVNISSTLMERTKLKQLSKKRKNHSMKYRRIDLSNFDIMTRIRFKEVMSYIIEREHKMSRTETRVRLLLSMLEIREEDFLKDPFLALRKKVGGKDFLIQTERLIDKFYYNKNVRKEDFVTSSINIPGDSEANLMNLFLERMRSDGIPMLLEDTTLSQLNNKAMTFTSIMAGEGLNLSLCDSYRLAMESKEQNIIMGKTLKRKMMFFYLLRIFENQNKNRMVTKKCKGLKIKDAEQMCKTTWGEKTKEMLYSSEMMDSNRLDLLLQEEAKVRKDLKRPMLFSNSILRVSLRKYGLKLLTNFRQLYLVKYCDNPLEKQIFGEIFKVWIGEELSTLKIINSKDSWRYKEIYKLMLKQLDLNIESKEKVMEDFEDKKDELNSVSNNVDMEDDEKSIMVEEIFREQKSDEKDTKSINESETTEEEQMGRSELAYLSITKVFRNLERWGITKILKSNMHLIKEFCLLLCNMSEKGSKLKMFFYKRPRIFCCFHMPMDNTVPEDGMDLYKIIRKEDHGRPENEVYHDYFVRMGMDIELTEWFSSQDMTLTFGTKLWGVAMSWRCMIKFQMHIQQEVKGKEDCMIKRFVEFLSFSTYDAGANFVEVRTGMIRSGIVDREYVDNFLDEMLKWDRKFMDFKPWDMYLYDSCMNKMSGVLEMLDVLIMGRPYNNIMEFSKKIEMLNWFQRRDYYKPHFLQDRLERGLEAVNIRGSINQDRRTIELINLDTERKDEQLKELTMGNIAEILTSFGIRENTVNIENINSNVQESELEVIKDDEKRKEVEMLAKLHLEEQGVEIGSTNILAQMQAPGGPLDLIEDDEEPMDIEHLRELKSHEYERLIPELFVSFISVIKQTFKKYFTLSYEKEELKGTSSEAIQIALVNLFFSLCLTFNYESVPHPVKAGNILRPVPNSKAQVHPMLLIIFVEEFKNDLVRHLKDQGVTKKLDNWIDLWSKRKQGFEKPGHILVPEKHRDYMNTNEKFFNYQDKTTGATLDALAEMFKL